MSSAFPMLPTHAETVKAIFDTRKEDLLRVRKLFDEYNELARTKDATVMVAKAFFKVDEVMVPYLVTRHNGAEWSKDLILLAAKMKLGDQVSALDPSVSTILDDIISMNIKYMNGCIEEVKNGGGKERSVCVIV